MSLKPGHCEYVPPPPSPPQFTIYAADPSGNSWTVCTCSHADDAQRILESLRQTKTYQYVSCYLTDNEERGDIEPEDVEVDG